MSAVIFIACCVGGWVISRPVVHLVHHYLGE